MTEKIDGYAQVALAVKAAAAKAMERGQEAARLGYRHNVKEDGEEALALMNISPASILEIAKALGLASEEDEE